MGITPLTIEHSSPEVLLRSFSPVTLVEIRFILQSTNASGQLDPIPSFLLKDYSDVQSPMITKVVNMSLEIGRIPESWELALVYPLLEKLGLDLEFEDSRPVNNLLLWQV